MFYEFDAATREPPPWQPESYKLIGRIAAGEGRFNQNSDVDINVEIKSIAVTKKGVYFAFRDQGACISILAVKVYYITCPAITINFAHFNETPTGKEITIIEQQNGVCVENAEAHELPTYLCKGDGKWTLLTGGCKCKVGFEADYENQICKICPAGTFRSNELTKCTKCPPNSISLNNGSAFCACEKGYYRHPNDSKNVPCSKPPTSPKNLTLLFIDQTSAILSWNAPIENFADFKDTNYSKSIVFKVKCFSCPANVVFNPPTDTFNDTKITITNLEPASTYTVQIHSMNGVSFQNVFDSENTLHNDVMTLNSSDTMEDLITEYAEMSFTTEPTVSSTVVAVRVVSITDNEADISWEQPLHSDFPIEYYEVRWFPKYEFDIANKTTISTKETRIQITNLSENTEYGFQVRCKTANGYGTFSNIVYARTYSNANSGKNFINCSV